MKENFGEVIQGQFEKLLETHVDRDLLEKADGQSMFRDLWAVVEKSGFCLALVSEANGGIGLNPVLAFQLITAASYFGLPLPFGETMVVSGALNTPLAGPATLSGGADGKHPKVAYGADADHVLVARDGKWLLAPASSITSQRGNNLAGEPRDALLVANGAPHDPAPWLEDGNLDSLGALVRAAQMRGAMQRALEMSIAYARDREQFGRPISKFQAVQHMLADAAGELAAAGALVDNAAETWGGPDFTFCAALAKSRTGEAAGKLSEIAHQVHGAIGFTKEHDLNFFSRRLWSWRDEFGSDAVWQEYIGRKVCRGGGAALWDRIISVTQGAVA